MKIIVVCTCSGMFEQAKAAYYILYPNTELPEVYKGKDAVRSLADGQPDNNLKKYLTAVAKKNGRFAFYIESDDNGDIKEVYNLMTGKRVA